MSLYVLFDVAKVGCDITLCLCVCIRVCGLRHIWIVALTDGKGEGDICALALCSNVRVIVFRLFVPSQCSRWLYALSGDEQIAICFCGLRDIRPGGLRPQLCITGRKGQGAVCAQDRFFSTARASSGQSVIRLCLYAIFDVYKVDYDIAVFVRVRVCVCVCGTPHLAQWVGKKTVDCCMTTGNERERAVRALALGSHHE